MSQPSQEVLVLAPHPDDETFGCGGTIKLISSSGGFVDVVYLTRGEMGSELGTKAPLVTQEDLAQRRSAEALAACRVLGVRNVSFLPGRDGQLHLQPELADEIRRLVLRTNYRSVFCPSGNDAHSDHRATFTMLLSALANAETDLNIWLYEVWTPLSANMFVPIDAAIESKLEAMRAHASQAGALDYVTAFRALAQYRSLFCPPSKFAEAFYTCDRRSLLEDRDRRAEYLPW
jgi:LmbE family N-acetylglucosaminyl deacetylase